MRASSNSQPKRRYGLMYWLDGRKWLNPNAHGCSETLAAARGNAVRHVERSELIEGEYRKAVVYDRWEERILYVYTQTAGGIARKDYTKERRTI